MKEKIDIRLERDPRYVAAKARYTELTAELSTLEREQNDVQAGLSALATSARDRINTEAEALVSGAPDPAPHLSRATLTSTLDKLAHRLAVVRSAIVMQRQIMDDLRAEVGKAIATDLLPQHRANVKAVAAAAIQLSAAMETEAALRTALYDNNVPDCGILRPMTLPGVGLLRDNQSRIFRFLLECHAYGFVKAADLPDVVRAQIPPPAKPAPALAVAEADGWLGVRTP